MKPSAAHPTTTATRVAIVTPHAVARCGLSTIFHDSAGFEVVGEGDSTDHVARFTVSRQPDAVVVDADLLDICRSQTIRTTIDRNPRVRFLLITSTTRRTTIERLFELGASGVITHRAHPQDYTEAVSRIIAGGKYLHPTLGANLACHEPSNVALSTREHQIAELIALGHTTAEISARLYLSSRTVESHRAHIKSKLAVGSRAEFVRWALDSRLIGPAPEHAIAVAL